MLMISLQAKQDLNSTTYSTSLPDSPIRIPPLAAESWPLHPLFTNNQAFIEWWMTRPQIIMIPMRAAHGQVNLSSILSDKIETHKNCDSELTPELKEVVELIGEQEIGDEIDGTTDHAWLVVLGHFAQALDLVAKLEEVSLKQRQGPNGKPQSKIIEFLVGILGGIDYLRDLNESANPIATDPTVVEAWAQEIFSHYSQVSRTLDAADEQTYEDVLDVLRTVSAPYIEQAMMESLVKEEQLTVDLDLTGRTVSPNSHDYPEAEFGWMSDKVAKGYQAAITSLVCQRWGRLILTLQRYGGKTLSADCVQAAIDEVEQLLQVRPRRRSELVQARRRSKLTQIDQLQEQLKVHQARISALWADLAQCENEIKTALQTVTSLQFLYESQGLYESPHSKFCREPQARIGRKTSVSSRKEAFKGTTSKKQNLLQELFC